MRVKNILAGMATAVLVFSLESVCVLAAQPAGTNNLTEFNQDAVCGYCGAGCQFLDEDGDGICDNYNQGICGIGNGTGYVDEDGDGICDNYSSGMGGGRGRGRGCGGNGGRGRCRR